MTKIANQNILITGGAGYIGSHMVKICLDCGYDVTVLDNLSTGFKKSVDGRATFIEGNISDAILVKKLILDYKINKIFHFAAFIEAGESVSNPLKYYKNNVASSIKFLEIIAECNVKNFIFSSSAAIFGEAKYLPIDEDHKKLPINPYGQSKLMIEQVLSDMSKANPDFKYGCLRYFNVSGADYKNNLGENHDPETHLIPLLIKYYLGKNNNFIIYGNDYDTKDGTCVRDYVHVLDICDAHLKLLKYIEKGGEEKYFNIGAEKPSSILDIIDILNKITNQKKEIKYSSKRRGDPAVLVSSSQKAQKLLKWSADNSDLEKIIYSAYSWEKNKGSND